MIGGKTNSSIKPTALGSMLNASTYGATKPTIIGTTRSALLAIWAANLRGQGGSGKKWKNKKKSPPTYVENIDFLVGSNPIEGVLQLWSNNTNRYTLDFIKLDINSPVSGSGLFPWMNHMSIVDSHFYFVLGVTVDVQLYGSFSDYGDPTLPGGVLQYDVSHAGTGYSIGDTFYIQDGNNNAVGHITAVGGGGTVTQYVIDEAGSGYHAPAFNTLTVNITGTGTGFEVDIFLVGKQVYGANNTSSDPVVQLTTEHPMWNFSQHGPNIINPSAMNGYPYLYYWTPACGNAVYFPSYNNIPSFGLKYHIYYMRLNRSTRFHPPITFNRMSFEQVLGSGDEYALAGLSSQQDLHPCDAGLGSPDIDLGTSGMIPDWRAEVKGSHCLHPHGDADFVDMIADTMMSGVQQVLSQLGLIQRGLNCNKLPGPIQKYFDGTLEPVAVNKLGYAQPNGVGNILLAFFRWRPSSGPNATIADTAVDSWTDVFATSNAVFGYATSVGSPALNIVSGTSSLTGFAFDSRGYIFEMDPGSNTILDSDSTQGTGASAGQVISVTVNVLQACYLMVAGEISGIDTSSIPPHWEDQQLKFETGATSPTVVLMSRYVAAAGSYTFSLKLTGGTWNLGIVAIGGQPSPLPKSIGDIIDHDSLELTRTQCWANGLWGSIAMNSQRAASEWLKEFYQCANAWPVWSGDVLKTIPKSEVSFMGNGVVYTSPTASGPVATLTVDDLVCNPGESPVTIKRKALVDANNVDQLEFCDRGNDYNTSVGSQPESSTITFAGPRKLSPTLLHEIQDPVVARKILAVSVREKTQLRNITEFTAKQKWISLEATDLLKVPDPNNILSYIDVRLLSVEENADLSLKCTAEPFLYGVHAPNDLAVTAVAPNNFDSGVSVANVNAPVFLEPPTAMTVNHAMELWIGVSDSDPDYGGCLVNISTDGGVSYNPVGQIIGSAVTGVLTQDWPAGLDPDFVNDLKVDLTESLGELNSYPLVDENNFIYPFYVEGSTTCGFELGTYSTAILTAANKYTLPASPNGLRRDVYHQPLSGSVDHPIGKRFMFLGAASASAGPTSAVGILKLPMQTIWEGQTLYFKFQTFNALGGGLQDIADCAPYTYVPGACAVIPAPEIVTIDVTSPAGGTFTIAHGLLNTPLFAVVQMTSDGDIQLQRPLSVDATNVYLVATDTGLTAKVSFFFAPADASVPLSTSAGGSFSVPHGLASTPTLSLVQMDVATGAAMGDVWKDATPYTSTNLNLVASDAGLTGKDYAWIVPPRTPTLTRFVAVALAPGAGGNFSVPHGLGVVPKLVIVRMSSSGRIWLQTPEADVTNLLLTASDAGITGEAEVWA